jgi:U3 small nucleolar RNA-associated protein 25
MVTEVDSFVSHFGPTPQILNEKSIASSSSQEWETSRRPLKGYGRVVELVPKASSSASLETEAKNRLTPSLSSALKANGSDPLVNAALSHLGSYKDLYVHSLDGEADGTESKLYGEKKEAMRKAAAVHAMNHVLK